MKKSLLMLGAAAMMLASCTQNEVMEVAESRAIGFDAFVNNSKYRRFLGIRRL